MNEPVIRKRVTNYGSGITFIDIDCTIFDTKSLIYIMKDGNVVHKLDNQEFNTYKLKDGEEYDFREFRDAKIFSETSIPIPRVIDRIKKMMIKAEMRGSRIVLLTARADFDDKEVFLKTFSDVGIPIHDIYVERTGNLPSGTISERKEVTIMKYIKDGDYRRVRLIDDDMGNIEGFIRTMENLDPAIIQNVKTKHKITGDETIKPIETYALLVVDGSGKLKRIE
ncbi:MAG: hypothetical protein KAS32_03460 [Candidatus Peribacteraceae bacterium]|nr:hypothetical protein [Candidatus Peribacteraceae bacterium]